MRIAYQSRVYESPLWLLSRAWCTDRPPTKQIPENPQAQQRKAEGNILIVDAEDLDSPLLEGDEPATLLVVHRQ